MPRTLKQQTIDGDTYRLYREPSDRADERYAYYVTENGTSRASRATQLVFDRGRADELYSETIRQIQRVEDDSGGDGMDMSMGTSMAGDADPDPLAGVDDVDLEPDPLDGLDDDLGDESDVLEGFDNL